MDGVVTTSARRVRHAIRAVLAVVVLVTLALSIDFVATRDHSARGAVIGGISAGNRDAGGLDPVIEELAQRSTQPVVLRTPEGSAEVAPAELGLSFDGDATRARLLEQPRNPVARFLALFGRGLDVEPVVELDPAAMNKALDAHRRSLEKAAVEGGVHYQGTTPVGDEPAPGERVAREAAAVVLVDRWLDGAPIDMPMEPFSPTVSPEVVAATVAGPAERATSAAVKLTDRRKRTVEVPAGDIASMLTFGPDGRGGLAPRVDEKKARESLAPDLDPSQRPAVSATFSLASGSPTVVPAVTGSKINWDKTLQTLATTAVADGGNRTTDVVYDDVDPKLTTEAARKLGVRELISEYTTDGFSSASGENIRLVAAEVDGALVLPGKVFSLNGHTGPRGAAEGYVDSTIINNGRAATAVGGGISQFATTLYNAAYFAGLEDVDHTEHAYYISRYPEAREATVFEGAIDLKFRNNTRHGVLIETSWSPSAVTVRLWGTKAFEVESITGERTDPTEPEKIKLPKGDDCIASNGSKGFTTSNTRIIRDARTGQEVKRHTRTVRYAPEPNVKCV
ncbi:Vancomycin resistance protein YoaR, contains peptidoglycan-binding and VanW domains [Gordonia westfalica]|uniref:Vancomycin resistance protein YoaR, contains peptidoglycan-binding and VanW domains n=1 Tax=Gordonia westfalica TaxID=158898 RepID=A0A1H2L146_9ACTN|nr:VanW family protein [Gordonia westfalica]SDU74522.1 Vancomycin resistance protein YoaR, contains peptidoglycan-binding and VanW domains [Gordonia westfalica]